MSEDLKPIDGQEIQIKTQSQDTSSDTKTDSQSVEQSRLIDRLERQLTPEMLEIIEKKLEIISDESRPFAMRLMSLQEFQQIMEQGKINFGCCNITNIKKIKEWVSQDTRDVFSSHWAGATERMTKWYASRYPMISEQQIIKAYKDAIKARGEGQEQLKQLDSLLAETVTEHVLSVYDSDEAVYDYHGPSQLHFYEKSKKQPHPDNDQNTISERVGMAIELLGQQTPEQVRGNRRYNITEADKSVILQALQSYPNFSMDNRRNLMKFLRSDINIGRDDFESFAPYQVLTIWPEKCAEKDIYYREERPWGDFRTNQDASKMLAVLSLTPNRAVYEELAQLIIDSENPNQAFPIFTPTGELVFPPRKAISEAKDTKEAERIRQEIAEQEETSRQSQVMDERKENQSIWQDEANRRNRTRGIADKFRRRNIVSWQDIMHEEANQTNQGEENGEK